MKWAWLKRVFGKRKLKSINAVEYIRGGYLIRTSDKLELELEIIAENAQQFKLAYSSPIFDKAIIDCIKKYGEINDAQELKHNGILINTDNAALSTFSNSFINWCLYRFLKRLVQNSGICIGAHAERK